MLIKYLLCVVLFLSITYAAEEHVEKQNNNFDDIFIEGSQCEAQLSAEFSSLKTESIKKLNSIDQKIPDNIEEIINHKLNGIEKKIPEKVENNLENILGRLQDYIDQKMNSLEKHINRKIDALEQLIPDKTDTNIINHKLDALKKIQLGLDTNNTCESKTMANEIPTQIQIENLLNEKLTGLEKYIKNIVNTDAFTKLEGFEKKLTYLEDDLKNVTYNLQIIQTKLDLFDNKLPKCNDKTLSPKLDELNTKLVGLSENVSTEWHALNLFTNNIVTEVSEVKNKIPEIENNMSKRIDALQTLEQTVLQEIYKADCKKLITPLNRYYIQPFILLDDKNLNHVTLRKNSDGSVVYFEMVFAIKSNVSLQPSILLSRESTYANDHLHFETNFYYQVNAYRLGKKITKSIKTTGLSPTEFTEFYIKIDNGTLEIGKKGSNSPYITYSDTGLKEMKYFSFSGHKDDHVTFLYDCPLKFQTLFSG